MKPKYQIFISSTYIDLIEERDVITKQILESEHFPIGMEMFLASDKRQWEIIKRGIDSSDIYILLVGYRYGSIDPTVNISYTDKEFEYAKKRKKPILVYIKTDENFEKQILALEHTPKENRIIPSTGQDILKLVYDSFYDIDQTKINAFRNKVMTDRTAKSFKSSMYIDVHRATSKDSNPIKSGATLNLKDIVHKTLDINVQGAIAKKIEAFPYGGWIQRKNSKWQVLFQPITLIIIISLMALSAWVGYSKSEKISLRTRMAAKDSLLFYSAGDSNLEYARVLPDMEALVGEANFTKIITSSKKSFWIITHAFKQLHDEEYTALGALKRGVDFKILLVDTATENYNCTNQHLIFNPNKEAERNNKNLMIGNFIKTLAVVDSIKQIASDNKYSGKIEVKIYRRPLYYQMWIMDAGQPNGIAHINIAHYDGFKPHFRITSATSKRLFNKMGDEFLSYWNDTSSKVIE